ncbi:DUF6176 family protein [Turicibacter sanguinis]|uniref:DUF6176 family protein n=1 Tax=Turicibacter sanguinis TaxID=154288 RepID=UPI00241C3514|nr:DUF6176 family protein [Turicibacter sanguinis]
MKIELTRFRVKKGKESKALEWMEILNSRIDDVLETLEGEKMYVETIFKEYDGQYMYLYWYSIQGEGGVEVIYSEHAIDKIHVQYWKECIDETYKGVDMEPLVSMIPNRVVNSFES